LFISCVATEPQGGWYGDSNSIYSNTHKTSHKLRYEDDNISNSSNERFIPSGKGTPVSTVSKIEIKKYTPPNTLLTCYKVKSNYKILLDPGHGGKDPGGHGNGIIEKDLVLTVSKKLKSLLEINGFRVYMTRTTDVYPTLQRRVEIAAKLNASFMVSIHANAISKPEIRGTLTIYPKSSSSSYNTKLSKILAESIEGTYKTNSIFASRGTVRDYRGLYILRKAKVPTVITEIGFMTNATDAKLMKQAEHQTRLVNALYNGIVTYLNGLK
jgi:N-acetylmuramoyl-L-alanine amidase